MDKLLNGPLAQPIQQIKSHTLVQNSINWYEHLSPRDQKISKALAVIMCLAIVFSWVWMPSEQAKEKAQKRYESELTFHEKMKGSAHLFSANAGSSSAKGSILSIVNNTAKAKGIAMNRFEPDGNGGLRIWLDKVEFDSTIDWLELLESEKGLKVEQISIDKVNSGIANVRATLRS